MKKPVHKQLFALLIFSSIYSRLGHAQAPTSPNLAAAADSAMCSVDFGGMQGPSFRQEVRSQQCSSKVLAEIVHVDSVIKKMPAEFRRGDYPAASSQELSRLGAIESAIEDSGYILEHPEVKNAVLGALADLGGFKSLWNGNQPDEMNGMKTDFYHVLANMLIPVCHEPDVFSAIKDNGLKGGMPLWVKRESCVCDLTSWLSFGNKTCQTTNRAAEPASVGERDISVEGEAEESSIAVAFTGENIIRDEWNKMFGDKKDSDVAMVDDFFANVEKTVGTRMRVAYSAEGKARTGAIANAAAKCAKQYHGSVVSKRDADGNIVPDDSNSLWCKECESKSPAFFDGYRAVCRVKVFVTCRTASQE